MKRVGEQAVEDIERAGQFAVLVDGDPVPLLSLPPGVFAEIQDRTGLRWTSILLDPLGRFDVAADLVAAAHAKRGVDAPDLDTAGLVRLFVEIPSDLPVDPEPDAGGGENPTNAS
jgi:hypothetical protein